MLELNSFKDYNTRIQSANFFGAWKVFLNLLNSRVKGRDVIWSEWRLTVIAATVRIALVDILDLSDVDIPAGGFLYPAVGWG